jgi:hypothetical protein
LKPNRALLLLLLLTFGKICAAQFTYYTVDSFPQGSGNPKGINFHNDTLARTPQNGYSIVMSNIGVFPTYSQVVNIPFTFAFYTKAFRSFCVSPNGILTFDTTKSGAFASPIVGSLSASNLIPDLSIACYWSSFVKPPSTATVSTRLFGTAPNRQFWIEWNGVNSGGATNVWCSLVLEEGSNTIYMVDKGYFSGNYAGGLVGVKSNTFNNIQTLASPAEKFFSGTPSNSDNRYFRFKRISFPSIDTIISGAFTSTMVFGSPFDNSFEGSRHQYLFDKNELKALTSYGQLGSIGFNVLTLGSVTSLKNVSIRLKNVSFGSVNRFETGLTEVYSAANVNLSLGWNRFIFNRFFQWDTTQNLLIEFCFNNPSTAQISPGLEGTFTDNLSTINYLENSQQVCSTIPNNTSGLLFPTTERPVIRLSGAVPFIDLLPPIIYVTSNVTDGCSVRPRTITASIIDGGRVDSAFLYHAAEDSVRLSSVKMQRIGNQWSAQIPAIYSLGTRVKYSLRAVDSAGNWSDFLPFKYYSDDSLVVYTRDDTTLPAAGPVLMFADRQKPNGLRISEIVIQRNSSTIGNQQTFLPPWVPDDISADDIIEIQNLSGDSRDISGYRFMYRESSFSGQSFDVVFPSPTILKPGERLLMCSGSGTNDTLHKVYFLNGPQDIVFPGVPFGIGLKDATGKVVDAVVLNGFNFNSSDSLPNNPVNGLINISFNTISIYRQQTKNLLTDWKLLLINDADTTSIGFTNPGLRYDEAK